MRTRFIAKAYAGKNGSTRAGEVPVAVKSHSVYGGGQHTQIDDETEKGRQGIKLYMQPNDRQAKWQSESGICVGKQGGETGPGGHRGCHNADRINRGKR